MPLFLDISELVGIAETTGIQRVVREITRHAATGDLDGAAVPVVALGSRFYRVRSDALGVILSIPAIKAGGTRPSRAKRLLARSKTLFAAVQKVRFRRRMKGLVAKHCEPQPIEPGAGDTIVLLDSFWTGSSALEAARRSKSKGAQVLVVIYDLFPIRFPQYVGPQVAFTFRRLLRQALHFADGILTISKDVRQDVMAFVGERFPANRIQHFYLGADAASRGKADPACAPLLPPAYRSGAGARYLMLGSIEPRRGNPYVLDAFDLLWGDGGEQKLMFIGKAGNGMADFLDRCRQHPRLNTHLFLVHDASDAFVDQTLDASDATIVASYAEGFGLPLIEALLAQRPVLASDIAILREVGGDAPLYFRCGDAAALAQAATKFELDQNVYRQKAAAFEWFDWKQATRHFLEAVDTVS